MKKAKKAQVFILLGQSNAVGHGIPMRVEDKICEPMKNVFGLSREYNQSFDNDTLTWGGYTSGGMNLAEEQDHTYSVANQLARLWQGHIDSGNELGLPDLYIVQIAIGAQGVTEEYMWYPKREIKLVSGKLGTVDISLFPFCRHIFSLFDKSFSEMGVDYEIMALHWRGGENDTTASDEVLATELEQIYKEIFDEFNRILNFPPIVLHRIVAKDRMFRLDPEGKKYERMCAINGVFEKLCEAYPNVSAFDARRAPQYLPDALGNGLFISDLVHFTPEVNEWVARDIMDGYVCKNNI